MIDMIYYGLLANIYPKPKTGNKSRVQICQ